MKQHTSNNREKIKCSAAPYCVQQKNNHYQNLLCLHNNKEIEWGIKGATNKQEKEIAKKINLKRTACVRSSFICVTFVYMFIN